MKKQMIVLLVFITSALLCEAQSTPSELLAQKIALKMKDSLLLSGIQKDQVYTINMQLHEQKTLARQQSPALDSLGLKIQRIENRRDSLYRGVLTEEQYILYRQKKRNLVNNN